MLRQDQEQTDDEKEKEEGGSLKSQRQTQRLREDVYELEGDEAPRKVDQAPLNQLPPPTTSRRTTSRLSAESQATELVRHQTLIHPPGVRRPQLSRGPHRQPCELEESAQKMVAMLHAIETGRAG